MAEIALSVLFDRPLDPSALLEALAAAGLSARAGDALGRLSVVVDRTPLELTLGLPCDELSLDEAVLQLAAPASRAAREAARRQRAQVRVTVTQEACAASALDALEAASSAAAALLALPGALALFDEPGRVLTEAAAARARLHAPELPLDLWIGLRRYELADAAGIFLDTLGMAQLALPDLEAYASDDPRDAARTAAWLRMVALHLAQAEAPLLAGHTLDGPYDEPWLTLADHATVDPPRPVLRFVPLG